MPTYQYACTECDHFFEQFQSFADDALVECPECSGRLRKVFNAVGVVFKGSGFYRNDSRSTTATSDAAPTGAAKADPASAPKTESSTATKTESSGSAAKAATSNTPAA